MPENQTNFLTPALNTQAGKRNSWGQLYGSSDALVIAQAAQQAGKDGKPVIVITPDTPTATRLEYDIRFYAGEEIPVLIFPDWEILPYDVFSPHQDIISERLSTLSKLPELKQGVIIVPVATLLHRLGPTHFLEGNCFQIDVGQKLNLQSMRSRLDSGGYRRVSQVIEHGEFAVRGSILDLFPMGNSQPFRIELFDDEVESIRSFDPESQRSIEKINNINLLPAREFPFTKDAITQFRQAYRVQFEGDPQASTIYHEVSNGNTPPGIEYYLPLFFETTNTLFDYLPDEYVVFNTEGVPEAVQSFWSDVEERYEQSRHDVTRPILPPNSLFLRENELFERIGEHHQIVLQHFEVPEKPGALNFPTRQPPQLTLDVRAEQPSEKLLSFINEFDGRVLFCAESTGRRETLLEILKGADLHPTSVTNWKEFLSTDTKLAITVAGLEAGLLLPEFKLSLIAEPQLFGEQVMQQRRRQRKARDADQVIKNLVELEVGSPVVHEDNGVGRYLGLQTINIGDMEQEFLTLEYAGGDKLFVPVSHLHLISRLQWLISRNSPPTQTRQWSMGKSPAKSSRKSA